MNMVTFDLVQAETRMRLGHEPLSPMILTALMSVEELRRLVLVVMPTSFLEKMLRLVVIMTLKLICFNGHLLMVRGPLGLTRDWMDYGLTRGCLTQIRLLDDYSLFLLMGRYVARLFLCSLARKNQTPCQCNTVDWYSIISTPSIYITATLFTFCPDNFFQGIAMQIPT